MSQHLRQAWKGLTYKAFYVEASADLDSTTPDHPDWNQEWAGMEPGRNHIRLGDHMLPAHHILQRHYGGDNYGTYATIPLENGHHAVVHHLSHPPHEGTRYFAWIENGREGDSIHSHDPNVIARHIKDTFSTIPSMDQHP